MSRPSLAPTAIVLIALAAPMAWAQPLDGGGEADRSRTPVDPMTAARGARYLLRNGQDYLSYRQYERALAFFREAEAREKDLNETDRALLRKGIQKARLGMREPDNTPEPVALQSQGRNPQRTGTFALARPTTATPTPTPTTAESPDEIQLAAAVAEPPKPKPKAKTRTSEPAAEPAALTEPVEAVPTLSAEPLDSSLLPTAPPPLPEPEPVATPPALDKPATTAPAELPPLPEARVEPIPTAAPPTSTPPPARVAPEPKVAVTPGPKPFTAMPDAAGLPPLPEPAEDLSGTQAPAVPATPTEESLPPLPAEGPARQVSESSKPVAAARSFPRVSGSTLPEQTRRDVEEVARRQEREIEARRLAQGAPRATADTAAPGTTGDYEPQANRLELPTAPSPTQTRPIKPIPVPDEFVPMSPRQWSGSRKAWAAAATCHGPLYFQDATLERYGQSAEQALGPLGRFASFPLDDPRQTNQRQQLLQPGISFLLFLGQIVALPYNMVVDPPWEAEYDLGYARPGDRIPPDTYYVPHLGVGPPLKGRNY